MFATHLKTHFSYLLFLRPICRFFSNICFSDMFATSKDYTTCLPLILKIISLISLSNWNLGHCAPPKKTAISTIEMPYEPSRDPKVQTMQAKSTLNDLCIVSDGDGLHVIIGSNGYKAMAMLLFARHCLHIIIGNVSM